MLSIKNKDSEHNRILKLDFSSFFYIIKLKKSVRTLIIAMKCLKTVLINGHLIITENEHKHFFKTTI